MKMALRSVDLQSSVQGPQPLLIDLGSDFGPVSSRFSSKSVKFHVDNPVFGANGRNNTTIEQYRQSEKGFNKTQADSTKDVYRYFC